MIIAVLNQTSCVASEQAHLMTLAVQRQIAEHVAPAWGRLSVPVVYYSDPSTVPTDASTPIWPVVLRDQPDQDGVLGWHSESGLPFGFVFAKPVLDSGGVVLWDERLSQSVAAVLSHEVIETLIDAYVNVWVDGPICDVGVSYAMEACDPVESDRYTVCAVENDPAGQPVTVSNFVYPAWFDTSALNPKLDHMGTCQKPFTLAPGGYLVARWKPGDEAPMFGDTLLPEWKRKLKQLPTSRTSRRKLAIR